MTRGAPEDPTLSIGALAKATGIPANTIRTWERRYGLLEPQRDETGRRRYTHADVAKLREVAELVRRGDRVSDLAQLGADALSSRRELLADHVDAAGPTEVRVGVGGAGLAEALQSDGETPLVIVDLDHDAEGASPSRVDALVVHLDALGKDPVAGIDALTQRHSPQALFVVGHLVARQVRTRLERRGVHLVRRDVPRDELRRRLTDAVMLERNPGQGWDSPRPARADAPRFSPEQLQGILNTSTDLDCECPNHLASLVIALRGFEDYSRQCESVSPEDARLHRTLGDQTGVAREMMEQLLTLVCEHEGIEL